MSRINKSFDDEIRLEAALHGVKLDEPKSEEPVPEVEVSKEQEDVLMKIREQSLKKKAREMNLGQ